jgi:hypothetical protein
MGSRDIVQGVLTLVYVSIRCSRDLVDKDNVINYQLVINYRLLTNTSIGYGTGIWNTEEYLEIFLGIPEIEGRQ